MNREIAKSTMANINNLKRDDIIPFITEYYRSIGRTEVPDFKNYSLADLKKCLYIYKIELTRER